MGYSEGAAYVASGVAGGFTGEAIMLTLGEVAIVGMQVFVHGHIIVVGKVVQMHFQRDCSRLPFHAAMFFLAA